MSTIRVHTTQNVTLEYEAASLSERIVAAIIDNVILVAWLGAWALVAALLEVENSIVIGLLIGIAGIPYVFYNLLCEVFFNGQSIGKKARNLRVVRLDGTAPRLGDYLLRWLLRLLDTGLGNGVVAVITIVLNGKGQRLGDLAAGTTVISLRPQPAHITPLGAGTTAPLPESYQPVFPQAAALADHDAALVRTLMHQAMTNQNYVALNEVANKVKALTGIQSDLADVSFLQTVLRDHAHLAAQ